MVKLLTVEKTSNSEDHTSDSISAPTPRRRSAQAIAESAMMTAQENAAAVLAELARSQNSFRLAIARSGGIAPLIELIKGGSPAQKLLASNPLQRVPWPFSASKWGSGTVLERMFPRLNSLLTPSLLFHHLFGPFLTKNDHISSIIRFQNQAFRSRGSSKMRISSS